MNTVRTVSKNALFLLGGSIVSQILTLVYVSILARYVGPGGFGQLSTAMALIASAFILVNFGFDTLIVRDVAADRTLAKSYIFNVIVVRSVLIVLVSIALWALVANSPYSGETVKLIMLYAVVNIIDAVYMVCAFIFHAYQRMDYRSYLDVGRQVVNVGVSLVGIWLHWTLIQLVWVSVFASLLRLIVASGVLRRSCVVPSWRIDVGLCRRLLAGAFPYFLGVLVSVVFSRASVVILSWMTPEETVGLYSAALFPVISILFVPNMVMNSVFPVMSDFHKNAPEHMRTTFLASFKVLLLVGFPIAAGLILVAKPLMVLLYGQAYLHAAPVLALLSVFLFTFPGYANGTYLAATNRQHLCNAIRIVCVGTGVVLMVALIPRYSYWGAALSFVAVSFIEFAVLTWLCLRCLGARYPWSVTAKCGLCTVGMAAAYLGLVWLGLNEWLAAAFSAPVYGGCLFLTGTIEDQEWAVMRGIFVLKRLAPRMAENG